MNLSNYWTYNGHPEHCAGHICIVKNLEFLWMQSVFNLCEVSHPPLLWLLVPFISRITLEMMMVIMRPVRPLPRPFSHHRQPPRIGAATVIGRPISPWKKTNHELLHWDSNWRAPRRMPLQYCAPYEESAGSSVGEFPCWSADPTVQERMTKFWKYYECEKQLHYENDSISAALYPTSQCHCTR